MAAWTTENGQMQDGRVRVISHPWKMGDAQLRVSVVVTLADDKPFIGTVFTSTIRLWAQLMLENYWTSLNETGLRLKVFIYCAGLLFRSKRAPHVPFNTRCAGCLGPAL